MPQTPSWRDVLPTSGKGLQRHAQSSCYAPQIIHALYHIVVHSGHPGFDSFRYGDFPWLSHTLRHRHRPLLCQLLKCLFLVVLHDSSLLEICDLHPTTNRLALSSPQTQIYQSSSPSHPPPPSPTPERNTHPTSSTFLLQALALSPTRLLRRVLLPYAVDDTVGFETGKEIVARSPAVGA